MKKTVGSILCLLLILIIFSSGASAANPISHLQVVFADSKWDGHKIPYNQQCLRDGGKGSTPTLTVRNIPSGANALIFEYSDATYAPMNYGGHGKIGFASLRGGTVAGDHDVIFAGPEEMITLAHRAENRMIFARGAVRAALWLLRQKPERYTMPQVLGLN